MDDLLELTARVEAEHFWFRGFRAFIVPLIAEAAGSRRNLRMIDCGCGTGHNLPLLTPYGQVFGLDLTAGGLSLARRAGRPLVQADITRIPFEADSFDLVTSFDVLQYADDDARALRDIARVLRPGGTLIMTAAALDILRGGHAAEWPEVRRYTRGRLKQVVAGAGLRIERLAYLFGSIFPLMLAVRTIRRLEGDKPGGDWEMTVPAPAINGALTWILRAEAAITRRLPLSPAGSSVLVVARKPVFKT
jgi:SAM-dependent methyltransferase